MAAGGELPHTLPTMEYKSFSHLVVWPFVARLAQHAPILYSRALFAASRLLCLGHAMLPGHSFLTYQLKQLVYDIQTNP